MDKAKEEFKQLRQDDEDFAKQYKDTKKDFQEWYEDVYLPSKSMKMYKVNFIRTEWGSVEVEAKNEDEAHDKALEVEAEGNADWGKDNISVEEIKEIK